MDVHVNKQPKDYPRPIKWTDLGVVKQLGLNLEAIFELLGKTVQSVSVHTEVPVGVVRACRDGKIKNPNPDQLLDIGALAGLEESNLSLLAKGDFKTEAERDVFWNVHLKSKKLLKPETNSVELNPDLESLGNSRSDFLIPPELCLPESDWESIFSLIPDVPTKDIDAHFKKRMLSDKTRFIPGVTREDFAELDRAGELVNWAQAYVKFTKRGQRIRTISETIVNSLGKIHDAERIKVLKEVIEGLWLKK